MSEKIEFNTVIKQFRRITVPKKKKDNDKEVIVKIKVGDAVKVTIEKLNP